MAASGYHSQWGPGTYAKRGPLCPLLHQLWGDSFQHHTMVIYADAVLYMCVCIYTHTHLTPYFAVLFQSIYAASNVCFYLCLQLNLQETCGKHNLPIGNITPQATDKPLDKTPKWHQHQFFKERLRWTSHSNNVNYTWWIKWEEKTPREFSEGC